MWYHLTGRFLPAFLVVWSLLLVPLAPPGGAQTQPGSEAGPPLGVPAPLRSLPPLVPTPSPGLPTPSPAVGEEEFASEGDLLEDYRVQPGDTLEVHIWGRDLDLDYRLKVVPQGYIFVPRLGAVPVNGRRSGEIQRDLHRQVVTRLRGVQVAVLVRQLARIKVFVTGQVARPGTYSIAAQTRLQELIYRAGGIIGNGSYRDIRIQPREGPVRVVDLTRFNQEGDLTHNPFVRAGDRIFVPFVRKRVAVTGEVVRPGIYEVLGTETLKQVLLLAGGPKPGAGLREVTIWQGGLNSELSRSRTVDVYELLYGSGKTGVILEDGDIIFLPSNKNPVEGNVVYVYGSVGTPGAVPYRVGGRLSDYINMAGGPKQNADLASTRITPASAGGGRPSESKVVDAYRIMYGGRFDLDPLLEVGTIIFVPERFFSFNNFSDLAILLNSTITLSTLVIGILNITRGR